MSQFGETLIGRTFGEFRIKSKLGEGSGGAVFIAEQGALGRDVALKILTTQVDDSTGGRFLREVRLASRLDHPYAAHVYASGADADHTLWIAMELVRGTPLDTLLASHGPIPLARFVPFFERLCEVVAAAHDQGIVHRDIKPANVMVIQRSGRLLPKLLDLGIARASAVDHEPDSGADSTSPLADQLDLAALSGASITTGVDSLQLTRAGMIVGTPHYMAPEQWVRASEAGARADIYSLSLLAYQALTGRRPFVGGTVLELARCHARKPLPPLGDGFAAALDTVLAKGAAKKASDRYASALELAVALRQAAMVGPDPMGLPQLPELLRDNWLHGAPQPIAECLEQLEASRSARQAVEAIGRIAGSAVRYLAMMTLAVRLRFGSGDTGESDDTRAMLAKLRSSRLEDAEWLTLAIEHARPSATPRAPYPIPELATTLHGQGATRLTELLTGVDEARRCAEDVLQTQLYVLTERLTLALDALTFLFDYPLVVHSGSSSLWMGPRRATRALARTMWKPPTAGVVALIDRDGAEVVTLSPLVQCLPPSSGAVEELFMLDGEGRGGARLLAWPSLFQRHDELLWRELAERGLAIDADAPVLAQVASPYKGLSAFSRADVDSYFGRERESESFSNRLRHGQFLAVVGPSGTGKSSFILAGVLPLLPPSFTPFVLRPTSTPFLALKARLPATCSTISERDSANAIADTLASEVPAGETWVLVVDQFEELVTLCADPAQRIAFAATLLATARHSSGKLRVVATLRDDFLIAIQQLSPFEDSLSSSLQLLGTPDAQDLIRVITEPAKRAGYEFDDPTLPARMVEEVRDKPGALALLSFTASQLWQLRDRQLHLMRSKTYQSLGGVGGALAHHAEATMDSLAEPERLLVRELFRHLVTAQGTRAVLSKREAEELLAGSDAARAAIEKLVAARLIVSSESATGGDAIEIIHEALIGAWPRLVTWQREDAESVRVRDALRASARQWNERGRPGGLLWRKEALAEYRSWRARFAGRLTKVEAEFAASSLRDETRARTMRRLAIAITVASLAVGLGFATRSWMQQKRRLVETWKEQARTAMMAGQPSEAFLYADAAERAGGSSPSLDHILGAAAAVLSGSEHFVGQGSRGFQLVRASRDERLVLALGDGPPMLLDSIDSKRLATWNVPCPNGAFSPNGSRLVLSCLDSKLRFVELPTLQMREVAVSNRFDVLFDLSPDGQSFAPNVEGDSITAFGWDGLPLFTARVPGAKTLELAFSPRGGGAVFSGDFTQYPDSFAGVAFVDRTGHVVWTFDSLSHPARVGTFDPTGRFLAVALIDHSVAVIDVESRTLVWAAKLHDDFIRTLAFDASGQRLLTTGNDGVVHIIDAKTGRTLASPTPPGGEVRCGAWLPGDREVLIGSGTGAVSRIDVSTGHVTWTYYGHRGTIQALAVLPRAGEFVSGSEDGSIWRWPIKRALAQTIEPDVVAIWGKPVGAIVASRGEFRTRITGRSEAAFPAGGDTRPDLAFVDFARSGLVAIGSNATLTVRELHGTDYAVAWKHVFERSLAYVAVADDASLIAAIDDSGEVSVFDHDGAPVSRFHGSEGHDGNLVFDSSGRLVVIATSGAIGIYAPKTGQLEKHVEAHLASARLLFGSRPGQFVTFGFDELVKVWDDSDWSTPRAQITVSDIPNYATVDPTGRFIAVLESSPRIVVYDLTSGKALSYVRLPSSAVLATWTADGTGMLAATETGLVRVPVFFSAPSAGRIEQIARCRISEALDGEQLVWRTPSCGP